MAIDFTLTPELEQIRARVRTFVDDVVKPAEARIEGRDGTGAEPLTGSDRVDVLIDLRRQAKAAGLWLPHMPLEWGGMGLGHVAMAMVQAEAAKSRFGPWVMNCQAPDEGNMHTLLHWATPEQAEKYLRPLCEGRTWSCFAMTEPEVAGSDPTLIQTRAYPDGDEWVINGHKWFISNAHRASFAILVCRTEDDPDIPQAANTAFLIDIPQAGWTEVRQIETMHGSTGHSEILIEDLRVHRDQMLGGRGQGHLLGQYRLGPARLAHCMRWIAQAETALDMMVDRSLNRFSHGSLLAEKQGIQWMIADSTMELYQSEADGAACRPQDRPGRRLQGRGVDGQALRGQHAEPGDRPVDPGARRARLLDRHAAGPHVPARPAGPASPTAPTRSTRCASPSGPSPPTPTRAPPAEPPATCRSSRPGSRGPAGRSGRDRPDVTAEQAQLRPGSRRR